MINGAVPTKEKVANLDSCVEEAKSKRDLRGGQPCRAGSTCESQTVLQAEQESYQP